MSHPYQSNVRSSHIIRKAPNQNIHPVLPPIDSPNNGDNNDDENMEEEIDQNDDEIEHGNDYYNNEEEDNNDEQVDDDEDDEESSGYTKPKFKKKNDNKNDNNFTQEAEESGSVNMNDSMSLSLSLSTSISPMELLNAQLKLEQQKSEKLEGMLHEERDRILKLEEMLHQELEKNDKLTEDIESYQKTIDDLKKQLEKVDHEKGIGLLREENSSLMDQIEQLQTELNKKQKQQGTTKLETDLQRAKEQLTIKDSRIEQLNNKYKNLEKENESLHAQIDDLTQKVESLSSNPPPSQKPKVIKAGQSPSAKEANGGHSRIPMIQKERYDPQRFGFKPRPTSADDHLPASKAPRFPGRAAPAKKGNINNNRNKSAESDEQEVENNEPAPILKKPANHEAVVKRPKLGALKNPKEAKPPSQKVADDEYFEDKLPVKVNKVEVSFGEDGEVEIDEEVNLPQNSRINQAKQENGSKKESSKPPPRRAIADNVKFSAEDNEETSGAPSNDSSNSQKQPNDQEESKKVQQPSPPTVPNKHAMQDNISFGDAETKNSKPQTYQGRKALESHIFFDQAEEKPVQNQPPIKMSGLSVAELQSKVEQLNVEKAELERQLNKALPKGKIMMQVRKEREDMEAKLDTLSKDISKLKLEIHFAEKK